MAVRVAFSVRLITEKHIKTLNHSIFVLLLPLFLPSVAPAYQADSRNTGGTPLFYESAGVPAATNRVIWFVADTNGDGVPSSPPAGGVLGPDDRLLFVDTLDGMLLGEHAGKHQRLNIPVPAEYASSVIYVYLWNVPWDEPVGRAGQTFDMKALGPRPPPALGNADWSVTTPLVADAHQVRSVDGDLDGLPDPWEIAHFGDAAAAGATGHADPDGDGLDNAAEFLAGTRPTDAASGLRVLSMGQSEAGWRIGFSSVNGKVYRLECCDDLGVGQWRPVAGGGLTMGAGPVTEIADPTAEESAKRFYRVRVLGP